MSEIMIQADGITFVLDLAKGVVLINQIGGSVEIPLIFFESASGYMIRNALRLQVEEATQ